MKIVFGDSPLSSREQSKKKEITKNTTEVKDIKGSPLDNAPIADKNDEELIKTAKQNIDSYFSNLLREDTPTVNQPLTDPFSCSLDELQAEINATKEAEHKSKYQDKNIIKLLEYDRRKVYNTKFYHYNFIRWYLKSVMNGTFDPDMFEDFDSLFDSVIDFTFNYKFDYDRKEWVRNAD